MPELQTYQGEALTRLQALPSGSVGAVVTDPPYSSGGAFRGDRMGNPNMKYMSTDNLTQLPDFDGDNRDQRAYGYWCALWLGECLRIAQPGAVCVLFTDWRQLPTTTDALQAGGWMWRGLAVWDKTEAARPQKGRYRNQCEYIVWGSKGPLPDEGPCLPGVFRYVVRQDDKYHPTGKPTQLMVDLLAICQPGTTVLDPFMGSGTTGVAALQRGLGFIGIEQSAAHYATAQARLHQQLSGGVTLAEIPRTRIDGNGPAASQASLFAAQGAA